MPKKVLVCDDELYILQAVGRVVSEEGYPVITAEDGETALQLARAELPDLVLLDIMMPKMNGLEVCRALKSDPATARIHIILLTAMGQERDMQEGIQCGADEYMTKPFSSRKLRKKLHDLLDAIP
ncbi:MAG: two-component system response regulator [Acidobacteria bacterium RIFCSPLOWO2_12_FULL_54_10]|nr:MAG: two-component system response regulator [Acidobacteria bacterium RIFCSPLOWO2_12_FULL_54_10]